MSRREPNRWGCKPSEDVCLKHCMPLVCRHGCEEAKEHQCMERQMMERAKPARRRRPHDRVRGGHVPPLPAHARADVPYLLAIARAAERVFKKWNEGSDYLDVEIDALRAALESKEDVR